MRRANRGDRINPSCEVDDEGLEGVYNRPVDRPGMLGDRVCTDARCILE